MNENELFIEFPSQEEKVEFMNWLNGKGFDQFLRDNPKTLLSCVSSFETGEPEEEQEYGENGYIEFE